MKKAIFFLIVSFVAISGAIQAQKFGLEIGSVNPKEFTSDGADYFYGGRIGVTYEYQLKNHFSLLSGALYNLVYSHNVQHYTSTDSVMYSTFNHSLDIPLRINYTLPLNKDLKLFAFAGPNLNIGLARPQKTTAILSSTVIDQIQELGLTVPTTGTEDMYKNALISRINFQMGAGGGIQWKQYMLKGGYDFGINSINKVDSNRLLHQSGWYVSLVYQF